MNGDYFPQIQSIIDILENIHYIVSLSIQSIIFLDGGQPPHPQTEQRTTAKLNNAHKSQYNIEFVYSTFEIIFIDHQAY